MPETRPSPQEVAALLAAVDRRQHYTPFLDPSLTPEQIAELQEAARLERLRSEAVGQPGGTEPIFLGSKMDSQRKTQPPAWLPLAVVAIGYFLLRGINV